MICTYVKQTNDTHVSHVMQSHVTQSNDKKWKGGEIVIFVPNKNTWSLLRNQIICMLGNQMIHMLRNQMLSMLHNQMIRMLRILGMLHNQMIKGGKVDKLQYLCLRIIHRYICGVG
jgi:hypothetical protein